MRSGPAGPCYGILNITVSRTPMKSICLRRQGAASGNRPSDALNALLVSVHRAPDVHVGIVARFLPARNRNLYLRGPEVAA